MLSSASAYDTPYILPIREGLVVLRIHQRSDGGQSEGGIESESVGVQSGESRLRREIFIALRESRGHVAAFTYLCGRNQLGV